jgi:uncharacterized protein YecE (DUF72 family)
MSATCYIGTSGFSYDHWDGSYYPPGLRPQERLAYYAKDFSTVEINSTFYKLQSAKTFGLWRDETPPEFKFTIKGSRYITHIKRLRDSREYVQRFFAPAKELGDKLAVTLWQTPPNLGRDLQRLEAFLALVAEAAPRGTRQAFEFRNEEWMDEKTFSLLDSCNCGAVIADSDNYPKVPDIITGGFAYLRFHGRAVDGYNYSESELRDWSEKIKKWTANGYDVFAYFNNDTMANAVRNAKTLMSISS